jgi:NitT/TauT family transport system permease protein
MYRYIARRREHHVEIKDRRRPRRSSTIILSLAGLAALAAILIAAIHATLLLRQMQKHELVALFEGAGATFLRVNIGLLLASLWTIPVGVAIGFNPRLAHITQPLAQIAASFPATALFPLILLGLMRLGVGLGIGSVVLMILGMQWYILFNVIAGALAIPSDLKEVSSLFRFTSLQRWTTVILPGIFPFLITGLVTASGGAWNVSIAAEYFQLRGQTLSTIGLGAQISAAGSHADYPMLLAATIIMALMVVTINRLVWRPLYHLAETKYRLD